MVFHSKYEELGFYVNGVCKRFNAGRYVTVDQEEIAVLKALSDVTFEEEVKASEPKAEVKQPAKSKQ